MRAVSVLVIIQRCIGLLCSQQPVKHLDYWYLSVVDHLPYGIPHLVQAVKEDVGGGRLYLPPLYLDGVELWGVGRQV